MKTFSLSNFVVITTQTRKYGGTFFAWAYCLYCGEKEDLGDPIEGSKFPKYEAATQIIKRKSPINVVEKDYKNLFKNVKNGDEKYKHYSEFLKKSGVIFI